MPHSARPAPQLRRLEQLGVVHRLAHGYYAVVPQDQIGTNWMPTLEAAAAGIATARFQPGHAPLMGVSAARLHGALPRALAVAIVAAPVPHDPTALLDRRASVRFVKRDTTRVVTLQIYGHRSTGKDRGAAEQLGDVIRDATERRTTTPGSAAEALAAQRKE